MSSPVIAPGVPPIAPPPRRRSLAGPFVLIILGAIFLMAIVYLVIALLAWRLMQRIERAAQLPGFASGISRT